MSIEREFPGIEDVKLPDWLEAVLPDVPEPAVVDYIDGSEQCSLRFPEGIISDYDNMVFESINDAYTFVTEQGIDFTFGEKVERQHGRFVSVPSDTMPGLSALLIDHSKTDKLNLIKMHYRSWLETADHYLENPDDFMSAYYFMDSHPCFWVRERESFLEWQESGHAVNLWIVPQVKDDKGTVGFMGEAGSHIAPEYRSYYHDLRLDVYTESYEDTIIELARRVHKFFAIDGSERENVEYEKSDIEKDLDAAVNEAVDQGVL